MFWRTYVAHITARLAASIAFVVALALPSAFAQQQSQRIVGTIEGVDGPTLVVKMHEGGEVKVALIENVSVFGVVSATLADITPGAFIGVGAVPQSDGSQRAIQVTIFADVQRGLGEGHRP